ncbi:CCR4-NOT transcription complex subunit 2-like isoform X1 [Styela clava]|uniref:CCR4-NOT transcription complex subunit 2-like n=1 Tax=Styela clava TaxID=7725 RepID=UPI00193965FD|nr:CCR4-NOT transcription complex subunit 2-like [Styela clava]
MFSSGFGNTPKKNMLFEDNDMTGGLESMGYLNSGSSVADMLGQSQSSQFSPLYGQQKSNTMGGLGQFGRSFSIPGNLTPTSLGGEMLNQQQQQQNRGIPPMSRSSMSIGPPNLPTSQMNNNLLSRQGMSPTRGISPDMLSLKQGMNRGNNNLIGSRNQSFQNTQSSGMNAIGSENLSQLRQQPQGPNGSSGMLDISEFPALKSGPTITSQITNGISNPFNLDQAEFPALAQRARPIGSQPSDSLNSKHPYGMLNKPGGNSEFQIQNEDFPALPGAATALNVMKPLFPEQDGRGDESSSKYGPLGNLHHALGNMDDKSGLMSSGLLRNQQSSHQKGIQVLQDNSIKNIPSSMLMDQYGVVGLLAFIKAAETDPTLVHLALGNDLTTLGLNLNSPDNLYHKFQSPFSKQPCRPQDIDFFVPSEYLTNAHIRDKLAPIKLNRYGEDLLFYVYYTNPGDVLQLAAAAELYNRDWRYHKEERIWITRAPGIDPRVKSNTYEQGTYYYFDCQNWRKVAKEFHLEYDKLEERPNLPNLMSLHFNPAQHA